jgi:hypothetical protein
MSFKIDSLTTKFHVRAAAIRERGTYKYSKVIWFMYSESASHSVERDGLLFLHRACLLQLSLSKRMTDTKLLLRNLLKINGSTWLRCIYSRIVTC